MEVRCKDARLTPQWRHPCVAALRNTFAKRRTERNCDHDAAKNAKAVSRAWGAVSQPWCHQRPLLEATGMPMLHNIEEAAKALVHRGWFVGKLLCDETEYLSPAVDEASGLANAGGMCLAGTGQKSVPNINDKHRCDHIVWIKEDTDTPALQRLAMFLRRLGMAFNGILQPGPLRLMLTGCTDAMLSYYCDGAYYKPHLDSDVGDERKLTLILYLNHRWCSAYGGALKIRDENTWQRVWPELGTLVVFRADKLVHEVEATHAPRFALTIWLYGAYKSIS